MEFRLEFNLKLCMQTNTGKNMKLMFGSRIKNIRVIKVILTDTCV